MSDYPNMNQQIKELFWKLITKYEKQFPEFADALNQCILNNINESNLEVIRVHEFSNLLDSEDKKQLINDMNWYFDYVISEAAFAEYSQTPEYLEAEERYWDRLRF